METGLRGYRSQELTLTTDPGEFVDLTDQVQEAVGSSGIADGQVTLFCREQGCSLLVQEREAGLMADIRQTLQRLRARRAGDHRPLIGSHSVVLPAVEGQLRLGTWQRVLLVETEASRPATVLVQISGR